ncbi:NADH-quinone oxidoreductase subunit G [Nocardioides jiangxiensis]|uniref:NADH-quinone oxidoreductase n=1 Tax=Nocardioides jiangxiensis TaxID=3064524 RepID=A0ABT9B193_9ACTN|nr:NADH-quinone oxidoreductase subunit G [Nocardioides sp. WY-20]MDO7868625.1 NADH-quinone oxidoreductase subunit G [Nocardioides sp. WY-20]
MSTPAKSDAKVTLTIDGQSVTVPAGTLVIRAAEQVGVQVPRFCDHPLLAPVGACRQCLVEVPDGGNGRPIPKPQASCTLTCAEGMVVETQVTNEVAEKAQRGVMELLLINHPLDCPVCDKGGECPLQNQAMSNGQDESRFAAQGGVKRTFVKPIAISPQILLDRERCIVCQRCTRFAAEIPGDPGIALIERGAQQQIGTPTDAPFDSYFSGNIVQICPVGALTSADYRFRARPFDLVSSPSIAEHDACGAAIRVDHRRGKVVRRLAGNDPEVNEEWISDKDRYAFRYQRPAARLTHPLVRDAATGELRAASWPEAFTVAARGLAAAKQAGGVGVLTGGRVTGEDAYAYSKFARVVLGTNDIDFRARPHSAEEAEFLASTVALASDVTYADLDNASTVVLLGLEPEDEAGTLFLRLRKAVKGGLAVASVAPYASRGLRKLAGSLVQAAPGEEAGAIVSLDVDDRSVILVGERLATSPGALSAAAALAQQSGARLAWVPRRAGDRGAVETGCLPNLLPGGRPVEEPAARIDLGAAWGVEHLPATVGREGDAILAAAASGELGGLVIGGVDLDDLADPAGARAAIDAAGFVVSLELTATDVTRAADVVFPVAPVTEKAGMFVTWEGRPRPFARIFDVPGSLADLRVLAGIAEEMAQVGAGSPLGFATTEGARAEMEQVGPWDGARPAAPAAKPGPARKVLKTKLALATWKQLVGHGALLADADVLLATQRPAVARITAETHEMLRGATEVTLTGDRGQVTLPVEVADLPEGVVWVPANAWPGGVLATLSGPGGSVSVKGVQR